MTGATPDMEIETEIVDDMDIKTEEEDDNGIKTEEDNNRSVHCKEVNSECHTEVKVCRGCKKLFTNILRHFHSKTGQSCQELYTSQDIQEIKLKREKMRRARYRMSEKGKERQKVSGAKYRMSEKCKERQKVAAAKYRMSEKCKEKHKIAEAKYRRSEKGKERQKVSGAKYRLSEKCKERQKVAAAKYRMSERGKETRKLSLAKWCMSEKGQEYAERKRNRQTVGGRLKSSKIKSTKMLQNVLEVAAVKPMNQTNYFIWETLFLNFLKMDKTYTPFLDPSKTWTCFSDNPNRGQSNEDINNLDNLILTLASYGPELLHQNIINECTSVRQFFDQVCHFYKIPGRGQDETIGQIYPQKKGVVFPGAQPSGSSMFLYNKLRNNFKDDESSSYEDFYLELKTAKYEALMKENSGLRFNESTIDEDEKMTSDIEDEIVMDWLEGIDQRLPAFIEHDYSSELQTRSLHSLQDNISKHLDSHLLLLEFDEKVRRGTLSQPHL